jgi:N-acetylneuraminic acid mutarotase
MKRYAILCFSLVFCLISLSQEQFAEWEIIGEMPIPVSGGQAVVMDDKIFILGGHIDTLSLATDAIQAFDPLTDQWEIVGRMGARRSNFVADRYGDSIIICGGVIQDSINNKSIEMFEGAPADYANVSDFQAYVNRIHAAGGVYGENLYLFGGFQDPTFAPLPFPYMFEYHIPSQTISYQDSALFRDVIPYQQLAARVDEEFYIFGGVYNNISNKAYKFHTRTHAFDKMDISLIIARAAGQAVADDQNRIFVIGGYNENDAAIAMTEVFYIFSSSSFNISGPELNIGRKELMAVWFEGSIYVFGGRDANGQTVRDVERLNVTEAATAVQDVDAKPSEFILHPNYPNPFNSSTTISFELEESENISLNIYSITGQEITSLAQGLFPAGFHSLHWDGKDRNGRPVTSGIYLYRLATSRESESKKMLYVP